MKTCFGRERSEHWDFKAVVHGKEKAPSIQFRYSYYEILWPIRNLER